MLASAIDIGAAIDALRCVAIIKMLFYPSVQRSWTFAVRLRPVMRDYYALRLAECTSPSWRWRFPNFRHVRTA